MPNYDYANSAGLTALSERTFEKIKKEITTDVVTSEAANPIVIETDAAQYAKNTHLTFAHVQDLHGYDHPWPAGGGKNKYGNGNQSFTQAKQGIALLTPLSAGTYQFSAVVTSTDTDNVDCLVQLISASGITLASGRITRGTRRSISLSWSGDDAIKLNLYAAASYANGAGDTATFEDIQIEEGSTATSYEPYSNICPITPMGHRNLLAPQSIADPFVSNGITFIVNADGSVTVNGTASGNTWLLIGTANLTAGERYVLTGGIDAGRMMQLTDYPVVNSKGFDSGSSGLIFTAEANVVYGVRAYIASGVTVNNETLYPMIRLASDPDSTFVPYGMARVGAKVTGFNIWDEKWEVGTIDGSTGQPASASNTIRAKNYIRVNPNTMYYFKSSYNGVIDYYGGNKEFIRQDGLGANEIITTPNNCHYIKIRMASTYGTTYNHDICINVSDAEKNGAYEPYKDYTAALDLPEEVYSGTLDLETGELVCDRALMTLDGSDDENFYTGGYGMPFRTSLPSNASVSTVSTQLIGIFSNQMKEVTQKSTWGSTGACSVISNSRSLYFKLTDDLTEISALRTYLASNPMQLCYELATPITYQLTPQQLALFKGINNISTNAKTVQVTYREGALATTGNIVDAVEVAKQNAIGESASYTDARLSTELAPILGDLATAETSPASASHAVGEYLLYNNRLYKVLAAISAGQQLTIGTNIGQTNVAAELASLNRRSTVYGLTTNVGFDIQLEAGKRYLLITSRGANSDSGSAIYIIAASASGSSIINVFAHDQRVTVTLKSSLVITVTSTEDYVNVWLLES